MRSRCLILAILATLPAAARAAEDVVIVGRTSAGTLAALVPPHPIPLPASVFPGIDGWASGLTGFHSLFTDSPGDDLFVLPESANLRFILISTDPGLQLLNDHGSDWLAPGEPFQLGSPFFDVHPLFNIEPGAVAIPYAVRITLHDASGQFADSAPIAISFTPARACRADWNLSGAVDSQDFFAFLVAFFAADADFNADGATSSQDFFDFLAAFFTAC